VARAHASAASSKELREERATQAVKGRAVG
jgi:hypothetical protein